MAPGAAIHTKKLYHKTMMIVISVITISPLILQHPADRNYHLGQIQQLSDGAGMAIWEEEMKVSLTSITKQTRNMIILYELINIRNILPEHQTIRS